MRSPYVQALLPLPTPKRTTGRSRPLRDAYDLSAGTALRAARLAAGVHQVELARALAVTQTTVSKWERGDVAFTVGQLGRCAHFLGTTPAAILTGEAP